MAPVVEFERLGPCFYELVEFRTPKGGEYYLSGAIVTAYIAYSDFSPGSKYQVVRPTNRAVAKHVFVRGAPINKDEA